MITRKKLIWASVLFSLLYTGLSVAETSPSKNRNEQGAVPQTSTSKEQMNAERTPTRADDVDTGDMRGRYGPTNTDQSQGSHSESDSKTNDSGSGENTTGLSSTPRG